VAGYRLERKVGSGGMGVVWLARDLTLERPVALKLIRPEIAADRGFRERFAREAKLAASLDHAHVLPVYEAGEAGGELYLAMRFVEGQDLATLLATERRLEPRRAARLLAQVALALDSAHAAGLVHRDVKPANILIATQDGAEHAYLSDFGLTIQVSDGVRLTRAGLFIGTVSYAAPEQLRGDRVDARTDVYALGCVLYQCLTGEVPYPRDSDSAALLAHLSDPVPRPSERASGFTGAFDAIVAGALAKAPEDRYQSAGELGRAAVTVANESLLGPTLADEAALSTTSPRRAVRARGARLVPMTAALVVAALVGIAVAAGAPWREESGSGTSAGAQSADDRGHKEQIAAVRSICDGVNAENGAVLGRYRRLSRRLNSGHGLRVSLIGEINRQLRVGDGLLARLEGVTPQDVRARTLRTRTGASWSKSLDRLRGERDALEHARSEHAAVRAATTLSRSVGERDRVRIRAGLIALGGGSCRLDPLPNLPRIDSRGSEVAPVAPLQTGARRSPAGDQTATVTGVTLSATASESVDREAETTARALSPATR
jgi:predicted Ser/Thr protein kinase